MEPAAKLDPITEAALRSLHDVVTPLPVAWWPQTWGWAALGMIAVGAVCVWLIMLLHRYRRNAYRREALRLMETIEARINDPATQKDAVFELACVLKRTALAAWPRADVAALSTSAWVIFLREHGEADAGDVLERLLDDIEYRAPSSSRTVPASAYASLMTNSRKWIERHHVST